MEYEVIVSAPRTVYAVIVKQDGIVQKVREVTSLEHAREIAEAASYLLKQEHAVKVIDQNK